MAVSLSIDLTDATFADLRALVDAARTAGVEDSVRVELEDTTLIVTSEGTADRVVDASGPERPRTEHSPRGPFSSGNWGGQGGQIGDAAIRSVIDILTGRQEPPRRAE
ncbi:hypothetical protein [Corynebacterium nasicanis]|uniref:Uncharacterized protein n=1 Tax=Corynebacterium nasicanis TaxID=1448267 RepID=A0ABW1QBC1_9CORY